MHLRSLCALSVVIFAVACSKEQAPTPPQPQGPQLGGAAAAVAPAGAPQAQAEEALVTGVTSLKREASDAQKLDDAAGKKVNNWVATLYRGEVVTVQSVKDDWAQVKASDDSTGWVKKDVLLPSEGTTLATLFEEAKTFNRPDLLAMNAKLTLEPGALLFVLKTKEQFSEVNVQGKTTAWVLSERLSTDSNEIAAAKIVNKIKWLKAKKDPQAKEFLELAKSQFGSSRLVGMLDEADKAGADAVPADGTAAPDAGAQAPN